MHHLRLPYKIVSLILSMLFIASVCNPGREVYGMSTEKQKKLEIVLIKDKAGMSANGITLSGQKPYLSENILYIPMKAVLETMGADIETATDGTIKVTFREEAAEIKVGSKDFILNQVKNILPAPPMLSGNTVMIPLDFLKLCFDVNATYDNRNGKAVITLKDDGALSDLSFLTGSITTSKAGNSYFGWSIALPRGSRVAVQSFHSKKIQFENEHFGLSLEVGVECNEEQTLQQYYDRITEDPYSILDTELMDSMISLDSNPQFIELLYTDSYEEAVYERIYKKGSNFFHAIVISYDEANPALLKNNKVVKTMLDSFSLMYKGNTADTADLSKVNFGLVGYSNYIFSETAGKKYLSWEMNVLPEWDLESVGSNPFNSRFIGNTDEYIGVELGKAENEADVDTIGKKLMNLYTKNFNTEYYHLISSGAGQAAGYKSYNLQYEVKSGSNRYGYDERLILLNGLVYDITFRAPLEAFEKEHERFTKMLDTFKPSEKDSGKILNELQKSDFNLSKNRLGKDETAVAYENKVYKWKLMMPGNWQKNSTPGQSFESFYNKFAGAVIMVEASALKGIDASKTDQERFLSMKISDKLSEKPVKSYTEQVQNRTITVKQYRIDDAESETFADVNYYIFDEGSYRYCFMTTIPDLTSSEFNLNSLKLIWNSFEIIK